MFFSFFDIGIRPQHTSCTRMESHTPWWFLTFCSTVLKCMSRDMLTGLTSPSHEKEGDGWMDGEG